MKQKKRNLTQTSKEHAVKDHYLKIIINRLSTDVRLNNYKMVCMVVFFS